MSIHQPDQTPSSGDTFMDNRELSGGVFKLERGNEIDLLIQSLQHAKEAGATHFYIHQDCFRDPDGDKDGLMFYKLK